MTPPAVAFEKEAELIAAEAARAKRYDTAVPGVYKCIVQVSGELAKDGISKTRTNLQQNYKFRGIDDVHNALAPILAKFGLVILPRCLSRDVVERQTKTGSTLFYVTVEAEFDFVCAADGSTHTVRMYGEAMDSADKATNKAMSAAYKYAAFQAFCIPTEGDDADATTHELAAPAPAPTPGGLLPSKPNGGDSDSRPRRAEASGDAALSPDSMLLYPPGYALITDYVYKGGWHEFTWGQDAQGGALKLSTRLPIGFTAGEAFHAQVPVKCTTTPKKPAKVGEAYLQTIEKWSGSDARL